MSKTSNLLNNFAEIHKRSSRFYTQVLARERVSLPQYAMMNELFGKKPMCMTEISKNLSVSKPSVTSMVDRLEKSGHLKRLPCREDRRMYMVQILPRGNKVVQRVRARAFGLFSKATEPLNQKDEKVLSRFFLNMIKQMDAAAGAFRLAPLFLLLSLSPVHAMGSAPPETDLPRSAPLETNAPLTLAGAYRTALQNNERIEISREAIEEAKGEFWSTVGDFVGDADYVISDSRQDSPKAASGGTAVQSSLNLKTRTDRKFVFRQPVFDGFKMFAALRGSGSLRKQRAEEYRRAKELLFLDVVQVFYEVLRLRQDTQILSDMTELFRERIEELTNREEIGRSRPSEVATALSRMKRIQADLVRQKGEYEIAQRTLGFLMRVSNTAFHLEDETDFNGIAIDKADEIKSALRERADVSAARANFNLTKAEMTAARSGLWPEVSVDGNLHERREGFQSGNDWDVLLTVDVPLFDGGSTFGEMKKAASRLAVARLRYHEAIRAADLEIKEAFVRWKTSVDEWTALKEAEEAAKENFRLQSEEYTRNLVNNLDVLDALETYLDTRRSANEEYHESKKNFWQLETALGKCCESI